MKTYFAIVQQSAGRRLPKPRTFEALYRDRKVREEAKGAPFVGIRLEAEAYARTGSARRAPRPPTAASGRA